MKRLLSLIIVTTVIATLFCGCNFHQHKYSGWVVIHSATCSSEGLEQRKCSCGEKEKRTVSKLAHNFTGWNITKQATCETEGSKERTCTNCSYKETQALAKANHSFTDWKTVKTATCREEGVQQRVCKNCDKVEQTKCNKLSHKWIGATCSTPTICLNCGQTKGSALGHNYSDATCTRPKTCKVCSRTSGEALGCSDDGFGSCIRCDKNLATISNCISAPLIKNTQINFFINNYLTNFIYNDNNFRFIKSSDDNSIVLSWGARNTSSKTIKHIEFEVELYDKNGNRTYDAYGNSTVWMEVDGPIASQKAFYTRQYLSYGDNIYYGEITNMEITYDDGSSVSGNYGYVTWHNSLVSGEPRVGTCIQK